MTDQIKEEALEIDADQLQEYLDTSGSDKLPPIEIPMEFYDTEEFHRGIKETSHLAGVITAFLNVGVDQSFILDFLLSKDSIAHNIEIANINKAMNVDIAKNQKLAAEKNEL